MKSTIIGKAFNQVSALSGMKTQSRAQPSTPSRRRGRLGTKPAETLKSFSRWVAARHPLQLFLTHYANSLFHII